MHGLRSWITCARRWTWSSECPSRPGALLQGQRDRLRIPARPPGISTMKKWLWLAVAVLVALLAWTAAGPYRTVNAIRDDAQARDAQAMAERSEEHTSELQSLMRHSYAVFCLKKKKSKKNDMKYASS